MSELTEDQKLIMLGLKQPNRQESDAQNLSIELENIFGSFDDFKGDFLDEFPEPEDGDFDAFEDWLADHEDIDEEFAEQVRNEYEDAFDGDFEDFHKTVEESDSFFGLEINFERSAALESELEDEDGRSVAGLQVYESGGVGRDGQDIPAGGVEVYGQEIYFSQATPDVDEDDPGDEDDDGTTYQFSYSDFEVSETLPIPNETITASATVSNPASRTRAESVGLYVDDEQVDSDYTVLGAVDSTTVEFTISWSDYGSREVAIGPLPSETVTVTHPSL